MGAILAAVSREARVGTGDLARPAGSAATFLLTSMPVGGILLLFTDTLLVNSLLLTKIAVTAYIARTYNLPLASTVL
jgi:hypothetical protein